MVCGFVVMIRICADIGDFFSERLFYFKRIPSLGEIWTKCKTLLVGICIASVCGFSLLVGFCYGVMWFVSGQPKDTHVTIKRSDKNEVDKNEVVATLTESRKVTVSTDKPIDSVQSI